MKRWGAVLWLFLGCGHPIDEILEAPPPEPVGPSEARPPTAPGAPPAPAPAVGIACDRPNAHTCDGADPLRCVAGSGGAKWMAAEPCAGGLRCVLGWGCLPLTACTDPGLLDCVDQQLFVCEADADALGWVHAAECPEAIPCVDGRGCPNPLGIGTPCSFVDPARCTEDGRLIPCTLEGIDAVWGAPEACPEGQLCAPGAGCRSAQGSEAPTRPPKGRRPPQPALAVGAEGR